MEKLRFALFGNIYQAKKSVWVEQLLHTLRAHDAMLAIDRPFHEYLTRELGLAVTPDALFDGDDFRADYAISMGGDGTFLQTASRVGRAGIPIIGINTGRMGFLADVSGDEIGSAIDSIYAGTCRIESRSLLEVTGEGQRGRIEGYALNEVAVLKRDNSSMISIRVDVDGQYLTTYQADGLIVNTPTGSTGYALSVGGPIMSPEEHSIGITPVAPHSLSIRPITLRDDVEVTLSVESRSHNFLVAIDGRNETCTEDTRLHVRKAPYAIRVLKRPESSFFHTLRTKLMWGNDVRSEK